MANGVYQRESGTWSFTIRLPADETGNRPQRRVSGFKTEAKAKKARMLAMADVERGVYLEPSKRTVAEYLTEEWLPAKKGSVTDTSLASYEDTVRRYLVPALGSIRLDRLTTPMIQRAYPVIMESGGKGGRPLSSGTVMVCHRTLRTALADAVKWGFLQANPAKEAKTPRAQIREKGGAEHWTPDELRTFLSSQEGDRLHPLWLLLSHTGLRRGEALGLHWADVDMEPGTLTVERSRSMNRSKAEYRGPKSDAAFRTIALGAKATATLKAWKATQAQDRLFFGPDYEVSPYIFTRPQGGPLNPCWVSARFRKVSDAIEVLPKIRLHGLRHTHASGLLEAQIGVKAVSERLGHADVTVTLRTYAHVSPAMHEDAADAFAKLVG